ncbi:MAG: biopolymer transporter ExbD [Elusimicrobia bacterium]|nr:biopolymer transporter ExbD [Elusimicrobiota bacterium]
MKRRFPLLRLRALQEEAKPVTEVNIIPVIDISLVLLVILFVTAPLLSVPNVNIELPPAGAPAGQEPFIAVTYALDGRLSLMSQPTDWDNLAKELGTEVKRRPDAAVVLRVDKLVPYRIVQRLLETAKDAGASRVALGGQPKQGPERGKAKKR